MLKLLIIQIPLICLLSTQTFGQKYEFVHYYTDDGLSQSTISAIEQDYQGFMWFGTFNGLNRFDGYSFKIYKKDPEDSRSLTSSHIEAIYEDSKNKLWIGTADGVNYYDRNSDSFQYYRYADPGPFNYAVHSFAEGKDGRLWVGGWQGLCYVDTATQTLIRFNPAAEFMEDGPKIIFDIEAESSGNLWLATNRGLFYLDIIKTSFTKFDVPETEANNSVENEVKTLYKDKRGTLWIGCEKGLYTLKGQDVLQLISPLSDEFISDIDQNSDGTFLIATERGLFVYNRETGDIKQYKKERSATTLSDNVVRKIFMDRDKHLWVGTFYGLNYNGSNQNFGFLGKATIEKPGLKNPYITSLCTNREGHIFVGTAEGIEVVEVTSSGIKFLSDRYTALKAINNAIVSLASDGHDNIFISSWPTGMYVYNFKKNILRRIRDTPPSCGLAAILIHENRIWIGCDNNLYEYNINKGSFDKQASFESNITYINKDSRSNLLLGGQSGMIKYNPLTGETINYRGEGNAINLRAKVVNNIHEDADKNFWVATGQGLYRIDKSQKLTSFWKKEGFADDDVKAITEDNHDNLWISTTNKLYKFNRKNFAMRKFEIPDGLLVKEFSEHAALKLESGHMVFGGKQGLIIFHPDSIQDNVIPPNVVITDFRILNQTIPTGSKILPKHISVSNELVLDYTAREFSFDFVGLNFSSPQKNQYAYMMEGFDKDWIYSGTRRFASYTNLPPGSEYVFRVKASNEDGVWNEAGTSIRIYINPPFWDTWWFKTITYAIAAILIYIIYRIRTNNIRRQRILLEKQKILLEEEVRVKTADLREANQHLHEQAERIAHMNALLQHDNIKLEHDLKDLVEARVMQKRVSFQEFQKIYPDDEACYKFIDELKSSRDFHCKKCNHHKCSKGVDYSRRCSRCNYIETINTGTIFAGIKFPISKAFYLLFLLSDGKHYTVGELSELVDLRQQTCWSFRKRIEERTSNLHQRNKDGWSHLIMGPDLAHENT